MKIINHRLVGVPFIASPNKSGFMKPTGAIMHYTAGFTARSAISTLTNPRAKVSAHLVIDHDGAATQLVEFNRIAWHAGPSKLAGRSGCNQFTIGFEFVNPGYFVEKGGLLYDWTGKNRISAHEASRWDLSCRAKNARLGSGTYVWPGYSRAQIETGVAILDALVEEYGLVHLAGHEEIDTRGWKTDPGPAFPWEPFKAVMLGNQFEGCDASRADGMKRAQEKRTVTAGRLNVRSGPSIKHKVITILSKDSVVVILQDTGDWSEIEYAPGCSGWIADRYLRAA